MVHKVQNMFFFFLSLSLSVHLSLAQWLRKQTALVADNEAYYLGSFETWWNRNRSQTITCRRWHNIRPTEAGIVLEADSPDCIPSTFRQHSTAVVQMWRICGTKCMLLWYQMLYTVVQMYHICTTLAVKVDAFVTMIDSRFLFTVTIEQHSAMMHWPSF